VRQGLREEEVDTSRELYATVEGGAFYASILNPLAFILAHCDIASCGIL
jgi:hypothetical protein